MRPMTFLVWVLIVTPFATVTAQDLPPVKIGDWIRVAVPDFDSRNGGATLTPRVHSSFQQDSTADSFAARYHATVPSWQQSESAQPGLLRPIGGGLIGAVVGVVGGGVIGGVMMAQEDDRQPWDVVAGIIGGVALGEPWGLACGVHIANGRRGNAGAGVIASTVLAVAGVVATIATKDYRILIAIPVTQLAAVVPIERASAGNVRRDSWVCRNPF